MVSDNLITLSGVSMQWNNRIVLEDINLTINKGDFIAVTGPNGGGKTTLMRIILKLLKPSQGDVKYYSGTNLIDRLPIGYLPQKNLLDNHFPITLREMIASGLLSKKYSKEEVNNRVDEMLALVGLESHSQHSIGSLSGGQLQRGLLARAIVSDPEILIFDEPLSYLDKTFEQQVYKIISDISRRATIVLVSHEMSQIASLANRHIIVNHRLHECSAHSHYIKTECEG